MQGLRPLYWIMDSGRDNFLSKHRDNHLNHEGQNSRASDLTLATENCGKHFVTKSGRALADWTNSYNTVFPLGFFLKVATAGSCTLTVPSPLLFLPIHFCHPSYKLVKIFIFTIQIQAHTNTGRERGREIQYAGFIKLNYTSSRCVLW